MEGKLAEGRAKGRDRKELKVNLEQKMENWRVQRAGGTMDVSMINNNMEETACFAGRLPLDPFSPLYHIAVVLIRCVRSVCECALYGYVCVFMKDFQVRWMRREM